VKPAVVREVEQALIFIVARLLWCERAFFWAWVPYAATREIKAQS
jgi:hypothetical protein